MAVDDYSQWIRLSINQNARRVALNSDESLPSVRVSEVPGPELETVQVVWRFVQQDVFQDFLDDFYLVGYFASFDFTVPGAGSARKHRFTSISQTADSSSQWTVTATLERFNGV
jgi:hypothetical protein